MYLLILFSLLSLMISKILHDKIRDNILLTTVEIIDFIIGKEIILGLAIIYMSIEIVCTLFNLCKLCAAHTNGYNEHLPSPLQ